MKSDVVMKLYLHDNFMSNWDKRNNSIQRAWGERQQARCVMGRMKSILQNIRRSNDP